jgi:hypothetical protein
MNNNLESLNNYLFEELERLNDDESLNSEELLDKELKRSKAITQVACQIVQNAKVVLEAKKHADQFGYQTDSFYKLDYKKDKKEEFKNQFMEFRKKHGED